MPWNNAGLIAALDKPLDPSPRPRKRTRPSSPCISRTLPSLSSIRSSAEEAAHEARRASIIRDATETPLVIPADAHPASPPEVDQEAKKKNGFFGSWSKVKGGGQGLSRQGRYEPFEVLRAVEKRDFSALAEIKASQFDLLVSGKPLPIVYALNHGSTHADIAILLVGALSRKVNDTSDDELALKDPKTLATLRAIRANLKIALSASLLASASTSLCSSYLQILVMLEGSRFIQSAAQTVSLALRSPPTVGRPVHAAEELLHKWVSRELKEKQIVSVEEYLANAAGDLVMLGVWGLVESQLPAGSTGEPVPLYFFARDDRILKAIEERLTLIRNAKTPVLGKLSRSTRRQLDITLDVLSRRTMSGPQRVEMLKRALDRGETIEGSKVAGGR